MTSAVTRFDTRGVVFGCYVSYLFGVSLSIVRQNSESMRPAIVSIFFLILMLASSALALEVPITVHSVVDGRTLEVRHRNGAVTKVQLAGLDAAKREVLARLAPKGKHAFVLVGGTSPQTSPTVAFVYLCPYLQPCTTTAFNLNAEVLRHGGAKFLLNFEDADLSKKLLNAQLEAQKAKRGVWAR
jgi:endonuclease YncB( thermonuclease family)